MFILDTAVKIQKICIAQFADKKHLTDNSNTYTLYMYTCSVHKKDSLQWNLDLTKLLGTGQICSLNQGFIILKTLI